eukprot:9157402-Ditylum_brightwellii.AAC.1
MAIVSLNTNKFTVCISACDEALSVDKNNAKALYLRAQARITPKSSGAVEQEAALKDLRLASQIDPTDKKIL